MNLDNDTLDEQCLDLRHRYGPRMTSREGVAFTADRSR